MSKDKDDILVGAQLSPKLSFSKGLTKIDVLPVIIDFRRLLLSEHETKTFTPVIPDIENRDLLHAVVALYSNSLEEMTPNILYQTVCEKWSRTIVLLTDVPEEDDNHFDLKEGLADLAQDSDVYTEPEQNERDAIFDDVYSDQDDVGDSDDEAEVNTTQDALDSEYDFTTGVQSFLKAVQKRKHTGEVKNAAEKRLIGAVTIKKTYCKYEKIMHLTVMCIRRQYRRAGIGSYLVGQLKDPSVSGLYDAMVVHADSKAVQFFNKHGFNDDIILNSKWSEIADQFTDCTMMTYLPPYAGQSIIDEDTPSLDATIIKRDLAKWRQKALEAYQAEAICVGRLQQELLNSRTIIQLQREEIVSLKSHINNKNSSEKKSSYSERPNLMDSEEEEDTENRGDEVKSRKSSADDRQFLTNNDQEVYDHCKDTIDFYQVSQMFLSSIRKDTKNNYEIRSIIKAILPDEVLKTYHELTATFGESPMVTKMYFLPTKESRTSNILKTGFLPEDFVSAEFGTGIYLSKSPKRSIGSNLKGKVILAQVALGKVETMLARDRSCISPANGFNSIMVQGRHSKSDFQRYQKSDQEFVIFDHRQLIPLYSLEYAIKS